MNNLIIQLAFYHFLIRIHYQVLSSLFYLQKRPGHVKAASSEKNKSVDGGFCVLYPPLRRHTFRLERPTKEINQKRTEIS